MFHHISTPCRLFKVKSYIYIYIYIYCNPDIRELSGPDGTSLISGFGLFCLGNTGSNLRPEKTSLISRFPCVYRIYKWIACWKHFKRSCYCTFVYIQLNCFKYHQLRAYLGPIPGWVFPKTQKMVLDSALLNTQHYKVRIKGKVEQSRERSC